MTETQNAVQSAPPYLSPSSAAVYNQCAKRWEFRYIRRLADPPGVPALVGTLAHRVLELLFAEDANHRTLDRARVLAGQAWPETAEHEDFVSLALDSVEQRQFKWRVWNAVEGLWQLEDPTEVQVEATEQRVEVTVGGVPFVGVIDRVERSEGQLVVTDYKSGKPPPARWADEKIEQVLLYAAAVGAEMGQTPARARLLYLGSRELTVDATPTLVGQATDRLAATWESMSSSCRRSSFEASTSKLCAWCPFIDNCEEGRAAVDELVGAGWAPVGAPALRVAPAA